MEQNKLSDETEKFVDELSVVDLTEDIDEEIELNNVETNSEKPHESLADIEDLLAHCLSLES